MRQVLPMLDHLEVLLEEGGCWGGCNLTLWRVVNCCTVWTTWRSRVAGC